ncbi:hypothetical protein B0A50_00503 [Salinomyces thailandicus]|uniref:Uncharacterized protein n=1 Tax=Salinomyces thailandicus TaxID=706561 RepID=A0A4U0UEH2_9PEZI|nr:hypothetical protein B0A50_00503 [Salinomyces thailandica]
MSTNSDNVQLTYHFYYTPALLNHVTEIPDAFLGLLIDAGYNPMRQSSLRRHPSLSTLLCGCALWWSFDVVGGVDSFNMVLPAPAAPSARSCPDHEGQSTTSGHS